MWVKSIQLKNIKGFTDSGAIKFSKEINVLVGANNSGKSTLLRSLWLLQNNPRLIGTQNEHLQYFFRTGIRAMSERGEVSVELCEPNGAKIQPRCNQMVALNGVIHQLLPQQQIPSGARFWANNDTRETNSEMLLDFGGEVFAHRFQGPFCYQREPNNFIYPFFSRRKPASYQTMVNSTNAESVDEDFENLPSKVDRIANRDYPHHDFFRDSCWKTLNLKISCAQWQSGKQAGLILGDGSLLPIDSMGEGSINIVALLAHLCLAEGRLFLIEEIENDLHPKALKCLLEVIIEKSKTNQFIISTHSNIVTRYLGGVESAKVFSLEMKIEEPNRIPNSTCTEISNKPEDRLKLLENLGYEPFDFFMWKAYLILEESTAERIIRDFLIPYMIPKLQGRLRTIAAGGVTKVEAHFSDLYRLFLFIHTTPQYKTRAWVAVDAGEEGGKVVSDLQSKFKNWPKGHFRCFSSKNFETYYPSKFADRATEILQMPNDLKRQDAKGKLAIEVLDWALAHPDEAKKEFNQSASEVLDFLREIQEAIA